MTDEQKSTDEVEVISSETSQPDSMQFALDCIRAQADDLHEKNPDKPVYISVSKDFNEKLTKWLWWKDYGIKLNELFGYNYGASPFIESPRAWVVGYFSYAQLLGQWNTFQDTMYTLDDLFNYYEGKENPDYRADWDASVQ